MKRASGAESASSKSSAKNLAKWLSVFSEHYGKELTPANTSVYKQALADLSPDDLEAACKSALMDCRFMPTVADIRAHVKKAERIHGELGVDAEWLEIMDKIQFYDAYYDKPGFNGWGAGGPPRLTDAGKYAVDCLGGFRVFQETSPEFLPKLRTTFQQHYERFTDGGGRKELPEGATPRSEKLKLIAMPEEIRTQVAGIVKRMPGA